MAVLNGVEKMQMAAFASQTKRSLSTVNDKAGQIPGPGAYDPKVNEHGYEHEMHVLNGAEAMKSASFATSTKRDDSTIIGGGLKYGTEDHIGPGSYNIKKNYDGNWATIEAHAEDVISRSTGANDASFASLRDRNIFEWLIEEFGNFGQPPR